MKNERNGTKRGVAIVAEGAIAPSKAQRRKPVCLWMGRGWATLRTSLKNFDLAYMPFVLFEDCNVGNVHRREAAFHRNKEKKA